MNKGYLTATDLANLHVNVGALNLESKRIKDIISSHKNSEERRQMILGNKYYKGEHEEILKTNRTYIQDGVKIPDITRANNKLVHEFHKILVDQKVSYIVGNPISISISDNGTDKSGEKSQKAEDTLLDCLGNNFDDILNDWVLQASNQAISFIHFYISKDGELCFIVCDSTEIIPIYDTEYQKNLVGVIRYYEIEEVIETGKTPYNTKKKYKVEWWTNKDVTYYVENDAGEFVKDATVDPNPAGHFRKSNTLTPDLKTQKSWGKVPFVQLLNNTSRQTDLQPIKTLIDCYDKVKSGWCNDIDDLQEIIYILKGYSVLSTQATRGLSELAVFLHNLKNNKVISVEGDGGVETLKAEIPVEAKKAFLEITRKEIFYFGQGVDIDSDKFGNNPSGVSLKFLYASLDMKANTIIRKMKNSLSEFMYFVTEFISIKNNITIDPKSILFTFNKAVIFNEKEKIDMLVASQPMLSERTILENHPLVDDVTEEEARLEEQAKKDLKAAKEQISLMPTLPVDDTNNNTVEDQNVNSYSNK